MGSRAAGTKIFPALGFSFRIFADPALRSADQALSRPGGASVGVSRNETPPRPFPT
jgi:hypothetical protein